MKKLLVLLVLVCLPTLVSAQTVSAPTQILFDHSDTDMGMTVGYRVEFFQCATITTPTPPGVPVCNGRATAPFQVGTVVAKSGITTTTIPTRVINLLTPPMNGALAVMPIGVGFVSNVIAVADAGQGLTGEVRSNDSNPFYPKLKILAPPTNVQVR